MKALEILDSECKSIGVHISDWDLPAIPPRAIPYVFPNNRVGTIRGGENFLGSLDVHFYCGTDSFHNPSCFTLWLEMNASQEEDSLARSELMGVLYLDENAHMEDWETGCDWKEPYIRALVYACILN